MDPGGYFIVKGQEKVILIHEQLSKNRVIVVISINKPKLINKKDFLPKIRIIESNIPPHAALEFVITIQKIIRRI